MDNDDELRARFRALAAEDSARIPPFSTEGLAAYRRRVPAHRPHRWWYAAGVVAAAATLVTVIVWPRSATVPLDLAGTRWVAPTDFLLDTPGSELLHNVPSIDAGLESTPITAAPGRGYSSGRNP